MSDFSDLDKFIEQLERIELLDGQKFNVAEQVGNLGQAMQPPLSDRLRRTSQEAENRAAMEQAMRGKPIDESKIEGAVMEYLREHLLKEFSK